MTTQRFAATQARVSRPDELLKLQESEQIRLVEIVETRQDENRKLLAELKESEQRLAEQKSRVGNLLRERGSLLEMGVSSAEDALRKAKTTCRFLKSIRIVLIVSNPVVFFAADKLIQKISAAIGEFEERAQSRFRDLHNKKERTPST
ncbi:MAG: hypothetical protein KGQ54_04410 [Verrucomicrobia bacterium]|nr:hypothetical protein [Verrucomicrobiota bacterium]